MEDARNTINACRAREATLHEEAYQSDLREKDLRKNLKKSGNNYIKTTEKRNSFKKTTEKTMGEKNYRKFTKFSRKFFQNSVPSEYKKD